MTQHFTQVGPMARFVDDLILTLPIIAGVDWRDPAIVAVPLGDPKAVDLKRLRVAFHTDNGIMTPTPEIIATVQEAARALSSAGAAVQEARPPGLDQTLEVAGTVFVGDGGAWVRRLLQKYGTTETHPLMKDNFTEKVPVADFTDAAERLDVARSTMLAFLEKYDAIVAPVTAVPAVPHGASQDEKIARAFTYTYLYNPSGWPGVVVRGGTSPEGLPIGMQVLARPWREDVALAVARHLETVLGGWRPPPMVGRLSAPTGG